jgi:hypothetical protein
LKSNVYPIRAPTPIQYQYDSVKYPRDFKTSTPIGSVEFGRTFHKKIYIKTSDYLDFSMKKNRIQTLALDFGGTSGYLYDKEVLENKKKNSKKTHMFPFIPKELIIYHGVLSIHHG